MPPPNHTEWERRFTQIFLSPPFWAFEKISKAQFCSFGLSRKSRDGIDDERRFQYSEDELFERSKVREFQA